MGSIMGNILPGCICDVSDTQQSCCEKIKDNKNRIDRLEEKFASNLNQISQINIKLDSKFDNINTKMDLLILHCQKH